MNELIKTLSIIEICKYDITIPLIKSFGFELKEEYSETEATRIIMRKVMINYLDAICNKYNSKKGSIEFNLTADDILMLVEKYGFKKHIL